MESLLLILGIVSIISSILCVVIVFLTRKNIVDVVDKDIILFEGNFVVKKNAIASALEMVDLVAQHGKQISLNANFITNAKKCYNELLCVVGDIAVAKEFYEITLNQSLNIYPAQVEHFKLICRKDIGFRTKVSKNMPESNESYLDTNFSSIQTQSTSSPAKRGTSSKTK